MPRRAKDYGLAGRQMKNFYYVYILVSQVDDTIHYTGITRNFKERVLKHNQGGCPHTTKHRRWRIETVIAFKSQVKHGGSKDT